MSKKLNIDKDLIIQLSKSIQGNITELARKYCEIKEIEFTDSYRMKISKILAKDGVSNTNTKIKDTEEFKAAEKNKVDKSKKVFFVTYAQNNTGIHSALFDNMEVLAKKYKASIIVNAGVYHNPNSDQNKKYDTTWHKRLIPYLASNDQKLHKYLRIITDANVIPTATNPLRGFEAITGEESSIIGHPRQHMDSVPTLPGQKNKFLFSTGAITKPNYRKARVGKKAEFNHQMGFLVVEILDKNNFVARHVSAKPDGSFMDLDNKVKDGKITKGTFDTIVLGDTHLGYEDNQMLSEVKEIAKKTKTKHVIFHDILDGHSVNNHIKDDYIHQAILEKKGLNSIENEVNYMIDWLDQWIPFKPVIVASNHDDRLDRWVRSFSSIKDVKNAFKVNEYRQVLLEERAPKGLVAYEIDKVFKGSVITLGRNDSFKRKKFELALHGDLATNGSFGSINAFRKLNTKIVTAHSHTVRTLDGAYVVGITCQEDHGYNKGIGSWQKSIGVINEFGKFQHMLYTDSNKFTNLM